MAADPNRTILTGENPFIRLSDTDGGTITTNASYWRIITCPMGPGHVLYLKSELTENRWRIYSDNIAMARWLQSTVQGMLNPETEDQTIPVVDTEFTKTGDTRPTPRRRLRRLCDQRRRARARLLGVRELVVPPRFHTLPVLFQIEAAEVHAVRAAGDVLRPRPEEVAGVLPHVPTVSGGAR